MNRAMAAPVLEPAGEGRVVLQSVNVEAYSRSNCIGVILPYPFAQFKPGHRFQT